MIVAEVGLPSPDRVPDADKYSCWDLFKIPGVRQDRQKLFEPQYSALFRI